MLTRTWKKQTVNRDTTQTDSTVDAHVAQTDTTVDLEMTTGAVWSKETKDDQIGQTPAKGTLESCFLDTSKVIDLPPSSESTDKMPRGIKENIYFVIQNEKKQQKKTKESWF